MNSADSDNRRLAVLISGGGRTLENLAQRIDDGLLKAEIGLVIASRNCPGAELAKARSLPVLVIPGVISVEILQRTLHDHGIRWVALAGYIQLVHIPPGLENRIMNIHPALLPAFGGRGMYGSRVHQAVLDAGCKVSGCTVHLCDDAYDRGPILAQRCCEVREGDTSDSLGARVFELERELYPQVIAALLDGRVSIDGRRARIMQA